MALADSDMRSTIGVGLRRDRIDYGLTPSQKRYCQGRANGLKPSAAYRLAFPNDTSADDTLSRNASALETDNRIVELVNELQTKSLQSSTFVRPEGEQPHIHVDKRFVEQGIANLAIDKTIKPQTRLSAYVHLGKMAGVDAFRDIVVHEKRDRTQADIDAEIIALLNRNGLTIDITPNASAPGAPLIEQAPAVALGAKDRRRKPQP